MTNHAALQIPDLTAYLSVRKDLLTARTGWFDALRAYLRPEQRPDAALLGDRLAESDARVIDEDDWVTNAVRGYVVVRESERRGRPFRLSVLQQGFELRVGVSFVVLDGTDQPLLNYPSFSTVFASNPPLVKHQRPHAMVDWHFSARDLYQSAQAFEDAVYKVGAIFETALQALTPQRPLV